MAQQIEKSLGFSILVMGKYSLLPNFIFPRVLGILFLL